MSCTTRLTSLAILLILSGCAVPSPVRREPPVTRPPAPPPPAPEAPVSVEPAPPLPSRVEEPRQDPFTSFPAVFRAKARSQEGKGDLLMALHYWRVVRAFQPEDPEVVGRVMALEKKIRTEADAHLARGKEKYREGRYGEAQREFLAALAYDPFLEEAADYLKHRLARQDSRIYVTKEGDTPKSVAREVYGDPGKDFLIAYFNGVDGGTPIRPGTRLEVPLLDIPVAGAARAPSRANAPVPSYAPAPAPATGPSPPRTLARPANPDDALDKARASFRTGDFKQAAAYAEEALEKAPGSREAKELRNAAYYQLGSEHLRKHEYLEALGMFKKVEASYRDRKDKLAQVESRLREEAQNHYTAGMKRFLAEDLEGAVKEWETTLALDPSHPRARKDLERSRRMLEQVRGAQ